MTRRACLLISIALLFPILIYAVTGVYSRFMADDFCYVVNGRDVGFPGFIPYYYDNWFGRITQIVGTVVSTSLGTGFGQVFPALVLLVWGIGLWWMCRELARLLKLENRITPLLVALLILYATLAGSPQIFHSLYWLSGIFPYTIPIVATTYYTALVLRVLRAGTLSPLEVLAAILLVTIAGFASEPFSLALVGALVLGVLGLLVWRASTRRAPLILLIVGLVTALITLGIMVAAPGNTLRQGLFTPTHNLFELAKQSFIYAAAALVALVWVSPPALPLALILPAVIGYGQPATTISRRWRRIGLLPLIIAFGLIVLVNVPAIYATSLPPPARTLIIPQFILVCAFAAIGYQVGLAAKKTVRRPPVAITRALVAMLIIAGPLLTAVQMIGLMPRLNTYASEWDQREQQIIEAVEQGERQLEVDPLSIDVASLTGLDRINTDATAFTNACAASYYGLESLVASS